MINTGLKQALRPDEINQAQTLALKINKLMCAEEKCEHKVGVMALLILVAIAFKDDDTEIALQHIDDMGKPEGKPDGSVGWN